MINTNIIGRVIYVTTQGRRMGRLASLHQELTCWGRGSGVQGTSEPALSSQGWVWTPESCDTHLASRPYVIC